MNVAIIAWKMRDTKSVTIITISIIVQAYVEKQSRDRSKPSNVDVRQNVGKLSFSASGETKPGKMYVQ